MRIRAEKDFWAGFLYLAIAAGFLGLGWDYRVGTSARMGPGYFPMVLGWLLAAFGLISMIRGFVTNGEPAGSIGWRPLAAISAAVLAFAALVPTAGLVFALPVLVTLSALASRQSVYDLRGLAVLVALTVFCIAVFVKGLGVPMPILGSWFDGLVPAHWQR